MPCHPPFPLMEFWSLKPPRSRQQEEEEKSQTQHFLYIYTHFLCLLNVQINRSASLAWSSRSPSQFFTFVPNGCSLC